jgi:hypothetical protein
MPKGKKECVGIAATERFDTVLADKISEPVRMHLGEFGHQGSLACTWFGNEEEESVPLVRQLGIDPVGYPPPFRKEGSIDYGSNELFIK